MQWIMERFNPATRSATSMTSTGDTDQQSALPGWMRQQAIQYGGTAILLLLMTMAMSMVSYINTFIHDMNANKVAVGWHPGVVHIDTCSTLIHVVFDSQPYSLQ